MPLVLRILAVSLGISDQDTAIMPHAADVGIFGNVTLSVVVVLPCAGGRITVVEKGCARPCHHYYLSGSTCPGQVLSLHLIQAHILSPHVIEIKIRPTNRREIRRSIRRNKIFTNTP